MNFNVNNYTYITAPATTIINGGEVKRVVLACICINKNVTGTITIKSGATTIGIIAAGTIPGTYWQTTDGIEIENLTVVNGSAEDFTVLWTNTN